MKESKKDIRSMTKDELQDFFLQQKIPIYKATQVYKWLWEKGVHDFNLMTNLSEDHRDLLNKHFKINNIKIGVENRSKDGTIKNLVKLHDNLIVESVLIPTPKRITACVSSQVGCSLDCSFCATSSLKRIRNLNADEIYDQVFSISHQSKIYFNRPLTNIVFMGMGEPLMNYYNVISAINKITSSDGLGISPRRITLSTSGIPKMIRKMADDQVKFNLAVSLHSARQEVRERVMPFAHKFPIEDLMDSLKHWYNCLRKQITFEYIIWEGINDQDEDIKALIALCKKIPCKVNLIKYNSIDKSSFKTGSSKIIKTYTESLTKEKIRVTFRRSRGEDIYAACGQLANKSSLV